MELSKRALGFLSRQYRIILSQNRLANALGTCALSALMCATAGFVAPENALADVIGVEIPAATESWSSTGDITVGPTSDSVVNGIYAKPSGSISITLESGHTITVTSDVPTGSAYAYGINGVAAHGDSDITITNDGTITAHATSTTGSDAIAYGIAAIAISNGDNDITNSGIINVTATATTNEAKALGINALAANGDNNITNNGTINATASATSGKAYAYGIYAEAAKGDNDITNSGAINATAHATSGFALAYGIRGIASSGDNDITNSGAVNTTATVTSGTAMAYGIFATDNNNTITNNGTINATATGSTANAYVIWGMASGGDNDITNSGTITATATATTRDAEVRGIYAQTSDNNTIANKGTMNISASAMGTGATASAYGIYVAGTNSTINNFGFINVSASGANTQAYQAYIGSGTANVGTWTLKFGENYGGASGYYVFGVDSGATLNFGATADQGANFIIAGLGDDFKLGQEYKISDMVYNNGGTVTGYIASATSPFDFLPVELIGSGSYDKQSIKATLDLSKDKSPAHAGATQLLATVKGHMNGLSKVLNDQRAPLSGASNAGGSQSGMRSAKSDTATMYADAGTTFTDAGGSYVTPESPLWKVFLTPFYSTTSAHGDAYETDMGGLVVGASRNMNDAFVFGFHASLAKADSDSTYTDSDALSYALGINGVYNIDESLYVRSQLTGFYVENELDMVSSTGFLAQKASADMDSYGMYVELAAGYDFALAPQHMLTPEFGLSYMYAQMEGFDSTFVGGISPTPFSMDSENYNALYADASVRWTGTFDLDNRENGNNFGTLKPTVKAGIRQALMDPETSSTMNVFGTSATTHADANETSFTCEAGLMWDFGDLNTSLTYTGEFGNVENSHMGMFKAEWEF